MSDDSSSTPKMNDDASSTTTTTTTNNKIVVGYEGLISFVATTGAKYFKSSWNKFLLNLLAVELSIKVAHLIDYTSPRWEELCKYVDTLKKEYSLSKNIAVLKLCEDVFIINRLLLKKKIEYDTVTSFSHITFIDIQHSLTEPKVITDYIPIDSSDCNLVLNFCNSTNSHMVMEESATTFLPALFGYILDYPIVYCKSHINPSTSPSSEDFSKNCLTMQPLKLYRITLHGFATSSSRINDKNRKSDTTPHRGTDPTRPLPTSFDALSFSFPVCVDIPYFHTTPTATPQKRRAEEGPDERKSETGEEKEQEIIRGRWWEWWRERFGRQTMWNSYTVDVSDVCLEHVLL